MSWTLVIFVLITTAQGMRIQSSNVRGFASEQDCEEAGAIVAKTGAFFYCRCCERGVKEVEKQWTLR